MHQALPFAASPRFPRNLALDAPWLPRPSRLGPAPHHPAWPSGRLLPGDAFLLPRVEEKVWGCFPLGALNQPPGLRAPPNPSPSAFLSLSLSASLLPLSPSPPLRPRFSSPAPAFLPILAATPTPLTAPLPPTHWASPLGLCRNGAALGAPPRATGSPANQGLARFEGADARRSGKCSSPVVGTQLKPRPENYHLDQELRAGLETSSERA